MRRLIPLAVILIALLALLLAASAKECVEAQAKFICNDGSGSCSGLSADCQEEYGCRCTIEEVQDKFNRICTTSFSGSEFLNTYNNVYPCQPPTALFPDGGHGAGAYASRYDSCDICGFQANQFYGEQVYYNIEGAHTPDEYIGGYGGGYSPFTSLCIGYGSPETCYSLYAGGSYSQPGAPISCGLDCFGNCIPMTSQSAGCTYKCEEPSKTDDNEGPYCRKSAYVDYDTGQLIEQDLDSDGYYSGSTVYVRDDCPFDIPEWIDLKPCDCNDEDPQVQQPEPEICDDGIDNDCDRITDCCDDDCRYPLDPYCQAETECDDGIDNDCDLTIDCCGGEVCTSCGYYGLETCCYQGPGDPDCQGEPECEVESDCYDGEDNDCDGLVDCCDPDCENDMVGVAGLPSCYTWAAMAMMGGFSVVEVCTPAVEDCTNDKDDDFDDAADCDDSDCRDPGNQKDSSMFTNKTVFFADAWMDYLRFVPVSFTRFGKGCPTLDGEETCKYPLIYGEPTASTNKEPGIFLNVQYNGEARQFKDDDYLKYWAAFKEVVVVENPFVHEGLTKDGYRLSLLASEIAALKNAPLVFVGDRNWERLTGKADSEATYCKEITMLGSLTADELDELAAYGHKLTENITDESAAQQFVKDTALFSQGVVLVNIEDHFESDPKKNPYPDLSLLAPQYALSRDVIIAMVSEPLLATQEPVADNLGKIDWAAMLPYENAVRTKALSVNDKLDDYLQSINRSRYGRLAVLASPEAIPLSHFAPSDSIGGYAEHRFPYDTMLYGVNFRGVGRIFVFSSEITSSYIQRALFTEFPSISKDLVLVGMTDFIRAFKDFASNPQELEAIGEELIMARTLQQDGWDLKCIANNPLWDALEDIECEITESRDKPETEIAGFFEDNAPSSTALFYTGHGAPSAFSATSLSSPRVTDLETLSGYPVAYSLASSNGNYYRGLEDTIAIRWLEAGGLAFLGSAGVAFGGETTHIPYAFNRIKYYSLGQVFPYPSGEFKPETSEQLDFRNEITLEKGFDYGISGDIWNQQSYKAFFMLFGDPFITAKVYGYDSTAKLPWLDLLVDSLVDYYLNGPSGFDLSPEYERTMSTLLLILQPGTSGAISSTHMALLSALPSYTKVMLFYRTRDYSPADLTVLANAHANMELFPVESTTYCDYPRMLVENWAQDYGEGSDNTFFISISYNPYNVGSLDDIFLGAMERMGVDVRVLPIIISGGNIQLARDKAGKELLFVGYDEFMYTRDIYKERLTSSKYVDLDIEVYKNILKNAFGVDEVVIVGDEKQPEKLFHIDQSFAFLADGKAAILKKATSGPSETPTGGAITGPVDVVDSIAAALEDYEGLLLSYGFELIYLETDDEHIDNFQSYTNFVLYKDLTTGQKTILLPVFSDPQALEELDSRNLRALEDAGYMVIPVRDYFYQYRGNLHCITNVLAYGEEALDGIVFT